MASLSLIRWSAKNMSPESSTVDLSTVPCRSSIFFSSQHIKRRHIATSAALRNSSSSSSSNHNPEKRIDSGVGSSKQSKVVDNTKNHIGLVSSSGGRAQKRPALSLKSLFGKRSLWRRIFFASTKVRSIILLNVISIVYASNIPVVKEVEAIIDPAAFTVVRFAVAAIPFIPFVYRARDDVHTRNAGIELGFWVSLGYLMQALGLLTSGAGRASFISMFTVIVVPLLDGMLGAIVPAHTWFGAGMSILGVAMLESSGSPPCVGDLLNFLSAVFFGVHILRTEHISRSTSRKDFLPLLGYEVCVIALFSTIWYFVGGWCGGIQGWDPSSWTWPMFWEWMVAFPWIPALYTGIFSTGLCLWVEIAAMRDVSATETAIIYGLEPVWGAGFAWVLLGERWGAIGWLGAALVLGGSLTVQIFGSSSSSSPSNSSGVDDEGDDHQLGLDKPNKFSALPVVVSLREDVPNLLKKFGFGILPSSIVISFLSTSRTTISPALFAS